MKDTITISWETGELHINLDEFFPADLSRTRTILKLLADDLNWKRQDIAELKEYFTNRKASALRYTKVFQTDSDYNSARAQEIKATNPKRGSEQYRDYVKFRDAGKEAKVKSNTYQRNAVYYEKVIQMLSQIEARCLE